MKRILSCRSWLRYQIKLIVSWPLDPNIQCTHNIFSISLIIFSSPPQEREADLKQLNQRMTEVEQAMQQYRHTISQLEEEKVHIGTTLFFLMDENFRCAYQLYLHICHPSHVRSPSCYILSRSKRAFFAIEKTRSNIVKLACNSWYVADDSKKKKVVI